jgi:hypothetical protein
MLGGVTVFGLVTALLTAVAFGLLHWLGIPAGNFVDWVIALASFEWLLIITTVPWNIHFEAKAVLSEAQRSREQGIPVQDKDFEYARTVSGRFLLLALVLHVLSAGVLYMLSAWGISSVGYIGSVAALLLTLLRPILRGAEYIYARLRAVRQAILYPREDIQELRNRVASLEGQVESQGKQLMEQSENLENARDGIARLGAIYREHQAENLQAHERLSREAHTAIAQLSTDGQVIDHVRELVRFFKSA